MKQKLKIILLTMLLIVATLQIIIFPEQNIQANPITEGEDGYLDFNYFFNITSDLSNIIHDETIYGPGEIKKGRFFGSDGDRYTAEYIKSSFIYDCLFNISNVKKVPLKDIPTLGEIKYDYSELINATSYELSIDNEIQFIQDTGLSSATIPQDDCYPLVATRDYDGDLNYTMNTEFNEVKVWNEVDLLQEFPKWQYGIQPYNVTYEALNEFDIILGNVTYVPSNEKIPSYNYHTVFILDEEPGIEEQLNDTMNASGIILLKSSPTFSFQDADDYCLPIMRLDMENELNNENISIVKEFLENGSIVIADNTIFSNKITFVHNLSSSECLPLHDFMVLYKHSNGALNIIVKCCGQYILNILRSRFQRHCAGIIVYDDDTQDCHYMYNQYINNPRFNSIVFPAFALPGFSINQTVGDYLNRISPLGSISGHLNQFHYKETNIHPGVEAYNIEAYLNINRSPQDKIFILSSRYDSMWGECPGDSGAGNGIIMGIAKYMQNLTHYGIKPKYNVTFLLTTNEENGCFGAQFYSDSHPDDNITMWIGNDQLGYNGGNLYNVYKNSIHRMIVDNISKLLDYCGKTGYHMNHSLTQDIERYDGIIPGTIIGRTGCGAEDVVFHDREDCDTILIHKGDPWDYHHRRGLNLEVGDVIDSLYFDWNDAYMFYNITWETAKYFLYNPDCWFSDVSFTAFDSPNDGDILNDSIRTNFTIHSALPSDRIRVELDLGFKIGEEESFTMDAEHIDYFLTSQSQEESFVFTIPDDVIDCNYSVTFKLYNSTGRVNKIVYGSPDTYYNDSTETSDWFHLYHPLGFVKIGDKSKCVNDNISGSVFTANEDGRADNITAYINQAYMSPGSYKCMLYQASTMNLIGTTTSDWVTLPQGTQLNSSYWAVFNFTGTKPLLEKDTQYVITCWGDSPYSEVYYCDSESSSTGRYDDNQPYGTPPDPAVFTNEPRYYSIYCSYTPDVSSPQITDINASPHTVGFGYNVTLTANVTDTGSGVNLVKVNISTPGSGQSNNTMAHISGNQYRYVFTDTWCVGQYNYSIWAQDNETNSYTSETYHFHVSADATISIATLKDTYSGDEYINITDPPNPPENLTLVARGLTWDKYYNAVTGNNILEVSTGPINYQEDNESWTPINMTINQLATNHPAYVYGYRTGNNHGLYGAYFKANIQNEWPVAFTYSRSDDPTVYAVRSKLLGVGYVDPASNWSYQYLQNIQSSQGQTTGNSITYEDVFTGVDVTWSYGNIGLKEEILLSNTTKTSLQNHPPSQYGLNDGTSYLVFITKLDHQNLNMYNASGICTGNITISNAGVDFKDALGQFKCALPLGDAYELNNEMTRQKLTYRIVHLNNETYLLSGLKLSDLQTMDFPVVIDPDLTIFSVYSTSSDGYIYNLNGNYNTAWAATTGTIVNTADYIEIGQRQTTTFPPNYIINRGFLFFNTSTLPSNAYITVANLSIYKKYDYSTTDFTITVQNGQPTYPHDPLQTSDYNKAYYSGNGGGLNTSSFVNGRNKITLMNTSWVNREGMTKLCLRSDRDISGTSPTGNEYVDVYSNEKGSIYQPKLEIIYRNQSKIKNTGTTDIKGYLLIQVQFYDEGQNPPWIVDSDVINETSPRIITSGNQLALDLIFNGLIQASELTNGIGTYRIYTAFRDSEGNILKTNDETELVAWWLFAVNEERSG